MMDSIGSAFFRADEKKCPACGDFGVEENDHRRCPSCDTEFTDYVILSQGNPGDLQNN